MHELRTHSALDACVYERERIFMAVNIPLTLSLLFLSDAIASENFTY